MINTKLIKLQIFGCLMKNPLFLSQTDKYNLTLSDFSTRFERYVFDAINTIYFNGAKRIGAIEIENYLSSNAVAAKIFSENNGQEYLKDAEEFAEVDNFEYWYNDLKKYNVLVELKKKGFDTKRFYNDDLTDVNAIETNAKYKDLTIQDIFDTVRKEIVGLEREYVKGDITETQDIFSGLEQLINTFETHENIGLPLQGKIFNDVMTGARLGTLCLRSGSSGLGKALPNSIQIPTPNGYKKIGEIKRGDFLFDAFGHPTEVLGVYPQGEQEVWEITFKSGKKAKCNKEHLWSFCTSDQKEHKKKNRDFYTETVAEIEKRKLQKSNRQYCILVPNNYAVEYPQKSHFIPPYVFGLALGDGSFRQHPTNKAFQYSSENEILPNKIAEIMGWLVKKNSQYNYTWYFKDQKGKNIYVEDFLREHLELVNVYSDDKFIPSEYLYDNIENRLELINGLLDSDGGVDEKGRVSYTTKSKKLKDDFIELAQSLGFTCHTIEDTHKSTGLIYTIYIKGRPQDKLKLFTLPRKKERISNWYYDSKRKEKNDFDPIIKIENLHYKEEMTCFYVDNKEHLFLINDYIVTHNTRNMVADACFMAFPIRFNSNSGEWEQKGNNEKVLYVVTEQTIEEIQSMVLAYITDINESKFDAGALSDFEKHIVDQGIEVLKKYRNNFQIIKMPSPTTEAVKAIVREECLIHDIRYLFFDYIFVSPSLVNEFSGMHLRNDEALLFLTTVLKDLATELNIFVMSGTQVNANADDNKEIRNESSLAGGRSTINKADYGFIMARPSKEELELLQSVSVQLGKTPNIVTDVYKVRKGRWTQVRIWSLFDYGTMRREDLFMTDNRLEVVDMSDSYSFEYESWEENRESETKDLVEQFTEDMKGWNI